MTFLEFINDGLAAVNKAQKTVRALTDYKGEMAELIRVANVERASALLIEFRDEYPAFAGLINAAITGTPDEALNKLAAFVPSIKEMDGARETMQKIQERLREEITKPRPSLGRVK